MKQRLVGAAVLVIAAVVFVPMVLDQGEEEAARIVPAPRVIEPEPEPLPADADARAVPLGGGGTAAPPAPAPAPVEPAPGKQAAPAKEATPAEQAAPAMKAAPAKKATPTKEPAQSGYAVQLGSFSNAANARGLRDKLKASGYAAFVKSTGSVTRVYVGPQPSRAAAEKMLKKLRSETKLQGLVVTLPG
jgi:DedD protein